MILWIFINTSQVNKYYPLIKIVQEKKLELLDYLFSSWKRIWNINKKYWRSKQKTGWGMTYSIHGHILYILEANSRRPNDFSLIRRKPNEILQFKWKRLMVLKFKPKLSLKSMLRGSKIIKMIKGSKNRRELTQIKAI